MDHMKCSVSSNVLCDTCPPLGRILQAGFHHELIRLPKSLSLAQKCSESSFACFDVLLTQSISLLGLRLPAAQPRHRTIVCSTKAQSHSSQSTPLTHEHAVTRNDTSHLSSQLMSGSKAGARPAASSPPPAKKMKLENGPKFVDGELDEDLHSRQLAVYGRESMRRMAAARVLVLGMKGLGVEVGACAV